MQDSSKINNADPVSGCADPVSFLALSLSLSLFLSLALFCSLSLSLSLSGSLSVSLSAPSLFSLSFSALSFLLSLLALSRALPRLAFFLCLARTSRSQLYMRQTVNAQKI